jgi:hypothetical protein
MDSGVMELADQISALRAENKRLRIECGHLLPLLAMFSEMVKVAELDGEEGIWFELPLAREIAGDLKRMKREMERFSPSMVLFPKPNRK